jgi:hypothetical protein
MMISEEVIEEAVARLVTAAKPQKIFCNYSGYLK